MSKGFAVLHNVLVVLWSGTGDQHTRAPRGQWVSVPRHRASMGRGSGTAVSLGQPWFLLLGVFPCVPLGAMLPVMPRHGGGGGGCG